MGKIRVCGIDELAVGGIKAFAAGQEKGVLYRLEDGFYATQAKCPHVFANLARGKLVNGCEIQCPLHRARFDVRTGEVREWACFPPGIQLLNVVRSEKPLTTWPVEAGPDGVFVCL